MKAKSSLLPEPRSYAGTALKVGSHTAPPFALLWSWLFGVAQERPFAEILPIGLIRLSRTYTARSLR